MFLNVAQLCVQYPGQAQAAVDGVSLGLRAGDIGVLIGPSGCGKTTLLRAVAGLERCAEGRVTMAGATVMPAAPGFYNRPTSIGEMVDVIVARALDHRRARLDRARRPRLEQAPDRAGEPLGAVPDTEGPDTVRYAVFSFEREVTHVSDARRPCDEGVPRLDQCA